MEWQVTLEVTVRAPGPVQAIEEAYKQVAEDYETEARTLTGEQLRRQVAVVRRR